MVEILQSIINNLNNLIWETPSLFPFMVVILLSYGIFITIRLGFIQLKQFFHGVKSVLGRYDNPGDTGDVNHFEALSTALSATVGIGNIAGVAIAIHYGGPGALFWMWLTAFLGMAVKYSECTLSVMYREKNADGSVSGGPMYYIDKGLGWKWLAVIFASMAVICSFLTGNAVQANTMADVLQSSWAVPGWVTGIISAALIGMVIIGGIKRIGMVTSKLAPLMALLYVATALVILMINYDRIIPSFVTIFDYAFNPRAGAFGVGSGLFFTVLIWGVKRGLFSNEAGQGSAPIAHGAAKTEEPVREGSVALLEPFIDTLVICTITGLVIISTNVWQTKVPGLVDINSSDVEFVRDELLSEKIPNSFSVSYGRLIGGEVRYNGIAVDQLYEDDILESSVNGTIRIDEDGERIFYNEQGEPKNIFYGMIIENGAPLTSEAFEQGLSPLVNGGRYVVLICVLLFGISTAISWSYYGDRAIQYLFGDKAIIPYKFCYLGAHFCGAVVSLTTIWTIGDIALGLMTLPNIIRSFCSFWGCL